MKHADNVCGQSINHMSSLELHTFWFFGEMVPPKDESKGILGYTAPFGNTWLDGTPFLGIKSISKESKCFALSKNIKIKLGRPLEVFLQFTTLHDFYTLLHGKWLVTASTAIRREEWSAEMLI